MCSFSKDGIIEIQNKLIEKQVQPTTEEATKQWLIMPFIVALGYNPYSSDIIPEYTLDVGIKKGEKVDYALQINNQPVALVECKQLNVQLSEKHISQLYRYFTISNVHLAILTNGDDYWFFTDSKKENIMDLEPYFKIKISDADSDAICKLEKYSKDNIKCLDIVQEVQCETFVTECKKLVSGLKNNNAPNWLLDKLAEISNVTNIDRHILANYLYAEVDNIFDGYCKQVESEDCTEESCISIGSKMKETMQKNKSNMSKIKINHEYTYNDYSDGDWKFHTLDYAIILGKKYEDINGRGLMVGVVTELLNQNKISVENVLNESKLKRIVTSTGDYRGAHYIEEHKVYVGTSFGIIDIIGNIEKLLRYADIPDTSVVLSFKA